MKDYPSLSNKIDFTPDGKYNQKMDKGNSRQIFEFILSPTLEQKYQLI